jgi:hypothetical protein
VQVHLHIRPEVRGLTQSSQLRLESQAEVRMLQEIFYVVVLWKGNSLTRTANAVDDSRQLYGTLGHSGNVMLT